MPLNPSTESTEPLADPRDPQIDPWIRRYYQHSTAEDLAESTREELLERARLHRDLAEHRRPQEASVQVVRTGRGWTLMIVTDDMPFLVSSVTAEVAGNHGGSDALFHPVFLVHRDPDTGALESLRGLETKQPVASGDTAAIPSLGPAVGKASAIESWISMDLSDVDDEHSAQHLTAAIHRVLADVRRAHRDAEAVREKVLDLSERVGTLADPERGTGPLRVQDAAQDAAEHPRVVREFLAWLARENFLFFGYKERDLRETPEGLAIADRPGTGLGILAEEGGHDVDPEPRLLTGRSRDNATDRKIVYITKANSRSTIHRHEFLDYIGLRDIDASGRVIGEYVILGLFSLRAYSLPATETPLMRERVRVVRNRLGFQPGSHSDKTLTGMIEEYPRLELLQADQDTLTDTFAGIMGLEERRRTRLFLRPDEFGRFVSAVVFLPRDRYNTGVRQRIEAVLHREIDLASSDFEVHLSVSALARIFFRLRLADPDQVPDLDVAAIERKLQAATRSWPEALETALHAQGTADAAAWADAAPATYRADYEIEDAVADVAVFTRLLAAGQDRPAAVRLHRPDGHGQHHPDQTRELRLKTYLREPRTLTALLPLMQHLGLTVVDQRPYDLRAPGGRDVLLYDFGVIFPEGVDPESVLGLYEDALCAVLSGRAESDSLDRLVLAEALPWHTVAILRAYTRYLVQLGTGFTPAFMADTLLAHPRVTRLLVELFEAGFAPSPAADSGSGSRPTREDDVAARRAAREEIRERIGRALDEVPTLDADRMLRALAEVVAATVRTNAYQNRASIALKVRPREISFAPLPRPAFEIWVHSPRVEGVHLRFGEIARGGLRWSDRREDFRTEVLGLVKAQMVKNAVIIPTGAKGGFYAKQLPDPAADREAWLAEGRAAYSLFIRSLLDVTDNLVTDDAGHQSVRRPEGVIALDAEDTYLVVAADKGTATFSDLANSISAEYGFWLGDAFASGGSVGYDHKAMGITARGAWESVKRHFAELGIDCQAEEFTAVGIGDMSGDVFGNGMLRSEHTRLVAAFDHRDIFIDPDPDPASSYAERQRLFDTPRSSWQDYDRSLISAGGGVFSRREKSIELTPQIREALGIEEDVVRLSPPDLVSAILKAPVDLLYNGGIGTYVKASGETHAEVGDKANDALRVDGADLRCRIVGEGGNLGFTQRGRIEAARAGVILNTDAIDNSAGVETSDREVNLKILVDRLVARGLLEAEERAGFIEEQTDAVARAVLETNREQNVLLQAERLGTMPTRSSAVRLMRHLEEHAGLDRGIEDLPSDAELTARFEDGWGLTGPELSVLAAYAKIDVTAALLDAGFGQDPWLARILEEYFPEEVIRRFGGELDEHPLRREIICTRVANEMVNTAGITFAYRVLEETGASAASVAAAFLVVRELFGIRRLMERFRALPADVAPEAWRAVGREIQRLVDRGTRWFIAEGTLATGEVAQSVAESQRIAAVIRRYRPALELAGDVPELLGPEAARRWTERFEDARSWGVPEGLARDWAGLLEAYPLLDVARLAEQAPVGLRSCALVRFAVADRFDAELLLEAITHLPRGDRWETLARSSLRSDLYETLADLTLAVTEEIGGAAADGGGAADAGDAAGSAGGVGGPADDGAASSGADEVPGPEEAGRAVAAWEERHPVHTARVERLMEEVREQLEHSPDAPRLSTLSVAVRALRDLV